MHTTLRSLVTAETTMLAPTVHEVVSAALPSSRKRLRGLPHDEHPALLPLLVRAEVRVALEKRDLPTDWRLAGNSRRMEELRIVNHRLGLDLRFLKERRRRYPGGVPPAGRNPSRRRAWTGPSIDQSIPGLEAGLELAPDAATQLNLLLVWDLMNPRKPKEGFTLRVVHPTEPGQYGKAVPCDLSLDLLPGGTVFDRLKFAGDDQDTNLFASSHDVEIGEDDADG